MTLADPRSRSGTRIRSGECRTVHTSARTLWSAAGLVAVLSLGGCAATAEDGGGSRDTDTPNVTGVWAEEFRAQYEHATTDQARAILARGTTTEAEYAEVMASFTRCTTEAGVEVAALHPNGQMEYSFGTIGPSEATAALFSRGPRQDCVLDPNGSR